MAKSPAFQFYASDFYEGTDELSPAQVGGYIRLMCKQWTRGILPLDEKTLQKWSGIKGKDLKIVLEKFVKSNDGYVNERLEKERQKQAEFRVKQSENGRRGGRPRLNDTETQNNPSLSFGLTQTEPNTKAKKSPSIFNLQSSTSVKENINTAKAETHTNGIEVENETLKAKEKKTPPVSPAPPEQPQDIDDFTWHEFLNFQNWLKENAPKVLQMTYPITVYQYQKLFKNHNSGEVLEILNSMHNTKLLLKKYDSAYITAGNWLKRNYKNDKPKVAPHLQNAIDIMNNGRD